MEGEAELSELQRKDGVPKRTHFIFTTTFQHTHTATLFLLEHMSPWQQWCCSQKNCPECSTTPAPSVNVKKEDFNNKSAYNPTPLVTNYALTSADVKRLTSAHSSTFLYLSNSHFSKPSARSTENNCCTGMFCRKYKYRMCQIHAALGGKYNSALLLALIYPRLTTWEMSIGLVISDKFSSAEGQYSRGQMRESEKLWRRTEMIYCQQQTARFHVFPPLTYEGSRWQIMQRLTDQCSLFKVRVFIKADRLTWWYFELLPQNWPL